MIKKVLFVAGAGVGYVLGTRAGREKYNALVSKARKVADRPEVQEVTKAVRSEANRLYDEGRQRVRARIQPDRPTVDVVAEFDPTTTPPTGARP
jgi:hypothetical protein